MRIYQLLFGIICLLSACNEGTKDVVYNENNTSVVNGVIYDMRDKPINGIYRIYYPHGVVRMEIESKNGKPDGTGKFYAEDGSLLNQAVFKQGVLNGVFYNYYSNGQIHNELNYINGVLEGAQKTFDENGELIVEVVFEHGKAVKGYTIVKGEAIDFTEEELSQLDI